MTADGTQFEIRELANGWIELFESSIALSINGEPDVAMAPHKFHELVEVGWFTIYVINPPTRWGIEWEIEYNAWNPPLAEQRR